MPSDGCVSGRPSPRNDSVASSAIEFATCTVATTISGGSAVRQQVAEDDARAGSGVDERRLDVVLAALGGAAPCAVRAK